MGRFLNQLSESRSAMLLVSPAEQQPELRVLGRTHSIVEKYGSDYMFASPNVGLVGIQRKQFPEDFLASLRGNDRVSRELQQMKNLDMGIWILEGMGNWTNDGFLIYGGRYKYFEYELWGFQLSLQQMGYSVFRVRDMKSTILLIQRIQMWASKPDHDSLLVRPKPGRWGTAGSREWALHFLQGLPGVGYVGAEKILAVFGGKLPFQADFGFEQMAEAVGPAKARVVCELFGVEVPKVGRKRK